MKSFESLPVNPAQVAQLKRLVSQGEGSMLEFKRRATFPEKITHEMIAFANTRGGILLLGIGDDGSLAGLKYPEDERHVMQQALKKVRPGLNYEETIIPISSTRTVIRYDIPESKTKPHCIIAPDNVKTSYVRVDDKSIKASREIREIVRRKQRMKDVRFHYGEHEKFLMQYLEEKKVITLKEFVEVSGLKKFYASRKLILLVVANVLRITPSEKGDLYSPVYR